VVEVIVEHEVLGREQVVEVGQPDARVGLAAAQNDLEELQHGLDAGQIRLGRRAPLTRSELRAELEEGTQAAAARAKLPPFETHELEHLLDIFASAASCAWGACSRPR